MAHGDEDRFEDLAAFAARQPALDGAARERLVEQALLLLDGFYAHLPRKRLLRGLDPVRRLELLRDRLPLIGPDAAFHAALCETMAELHDLHTAYVLPGGHANAVAVLPVRIGDCGPAGARRFLLTDVRPEAAAAGLARGQEVLRWNGVPVARAVGRLAWASAAASTEAQHARAVRELTLRPLATAPPPETTEVRLTCRDGDGRERTARLSWRVLLLADPLAAPHDPSHHGLDLGADLRRRAHDRLRPTAPPPPDPAWEALPEGRLPALLRARRRRDGSCGHLRVRGFRTEDADGFVAEFARLLSLLPQGGLVVDVRDNGGGLVEAAERALRLLAPGPVVPVGFQLLAGAATAGLCAVEPELAPWAASVSRAMRTGAPYSDALPLTDPALCNAGAAGPRYPGPVVLLVDPLCYSACDVFAAGFADNGAGRILGTGATGGGGANVWPHERLRAAFDRPGSPFQPLPAGSGLRVALRRALRSGRSEGVEIEERGIAPDVLHVTTERDLLEEDADLMDRALAMLGEMRATGGVARPG